MKAPLVVAAVQAPTLLNRWANSTRWTLRVADLQDPHYAERALLEVPAWRPADGYPRAVLVCSPNQAGRARRTFPRARLVWVLHTAQPGYGIPRDMHARAAVRGPYVALSARVAAAHASRLGNKIHLIRPAYEPRAAHRWKAHILWTMRSRPSTRHPDEVDVLHATLARAGINGEHTLYGEDQPGGFLDTPRKQSLMAACSAYVSCLPLWAGFGLAEHEMFEAGVPVVGTRWGDTPNEVPGAYTALTDADDERAALLRDLAGHSKTAERLRECGYDYLRTWRTMRALDEDVSRFLEAVG